MPLTLGLGILPARIVIFEGTDYFTFNIMNNENIDVIVNLSLLGDDFLVLEKEQYFLKSDQNQIVVNVSVKEGFYESTKTAQIRILEIREVDSQIGINQGFLLPVSLIIYKEDAFLVPSMRMPPPQNMGRGPYTLTLRNDGLKDVIDGVAIFTILGVVKEKTISVPATESESFIFMFDEPFKKGIHAAKLEIKYNDEVIENIFRVQSGFPEPVVESIKPIAIVGDFLELNLKVRNDWSEEQSDLVVFLRTDIEASQTQTFSVGASSHRELNHIIRIPSNNFELETRINDFTVETYTVLINEDLVTINGVTYDLGEIDFEIIDKEKSSLVFWLILFAVLVVLFVLLFKKKLKLSA